MNNGDVVFVSGADYNLAQDNVIRVFVRPGLMDKAEDLPVEAQRVAESWADRAMGPYKKVTVRPISVVRPKRDRAGKYFYFHVVG